MLGGILNRASSAEMLYLPGKVPRFEPPTELPAAGRLPAPFQVPLEQLRLITSRAMAMGRDDVSRGSTGMVIPPKNVTPGEFIPQVNKTMI